MPEPVGATYPNSAVGGAQQTVNLLLKDGFAEPAILEAQEVIQAIRHPQAARIIGRGETDVIYSGQRLEIVRRLHRGLDSGFGKAIQPVDRADPDVALAIDEHSKGSPRAQSVGDRVRVRQGIGADDSAKRWALRVGNPAHTVEC